MKNIYIFHGWSSNSKDAWIPWLKNELELKKYNVVTPDFSYAYLPSSSIFSLLENIIQNPTENDYIVSHSAGGHLAVRYLEYLNQKYEGEVKIGGMVLVAPFHRVNLKAVKGGLIRAILNSNDEEMITNSTKIIESSLEEAKKWSSIPIKWNCIRQVSCKNECIFSDNDIFVPRSEHKTFEDGLLLEKVEVIKDAGHFRKEDGFETFPKLRDILLEIL